MLLCIVIYWWHCLVYILLVVGLAFNIVNQKNEKIYKKKKKNVYLKQQHIRSFIDLLHSTVNLTIIVTDNNYNKYNIALKIFSVLTI